MVKSTGYQTLNISPTLWRYIMQKKLDLGLGSAEETLIALLKRSRKINNRIAKEEVTNETPSE